MEDSDTEYEIEFEIDVDEIEMEGATENVEITREHSSEDNSYFADIDASETKEDQEEIEPEEDEEDEKNLWEKIKNNCSLMAWYYE